MLRTVQRTLEEAHALAAGDCMVIAVSGGADSMALLHALHAVRERWDLTLIVAHLDHGLRGDRSAEDARFVAGQAEQLGLACVVDRADVGRRAEGRGESLETAAREMRYAFLTRVAHTHGAGVVATGHTRNDQAETVLLRLIRGAGARGLRAMTVRSVRDGLRLVRPLLACSRAEVTTFLQQRGIGWREDESNASDQHLRNRVRQELLPLLEARFNPGVIDVLVRTAEVLGEEDAFLEELAAERLAAAAASTAAGTLALPGLRRAPRALQRRMVRQWLSSHEAAPDYRTVARVLDLVESGEGAGYVPLPRGGWVERAYHQLAVRSAGPVAPFCIPLPIPGHAQGPGWRAVARPASGFQRRSGSGVGELPAEAWIRRDQAEARSMAFRNWRPGDVIAPLGMQGRTKLHDLWINAKVPRSRRKRIPLLVCQDEVVWVPGYRVARGWEVPAPDALSIHIELVEDEGQSPAVSPAPAGAG